MATTSPDNIWTPDSGDGYALTQDLAAFADTTQDALVVRANYYTGDNSQMANQESKATEGSMFFNTDDGKEYRLVSGAWAEEYSAEAPIYCALRLSTPQSLTTTAAPVLWDAEISDPAGMHSTVTNPGRITAPVDGLYEFTATLLNGNSSGLGTAYATLNGATDGLPGSLDRNVGQSGAACYLKVTFSVALTAGDYVQIMVLHATATNVISGGSTQFASTVTCKRLGPA